MPNSPAKLAIMVSGGGRTLENLLHAINDGRLNAQVSLVIASRECRAAEMARAHKIDLLILPGRIDAAVLESVLKARSIDWVALAGYLNLVNIPKSYAGRVVNIHPALLPAFGGAGLYGDRVHRAVIESGCRVSGCTVHLCDSRYDTGPIVAQSCCDVLDDDTPETLAKKIFELECKLYPQALNELITGKCRIEGRRARQCR